jgi:hypothetical protein
MNTIDRFMKKVLKQPNGCWDWQAQLDKGGYGRFQNKAAHRWSYQYFKSDPGQLLVCHNCDNRKCVNPDHLWIGSHQDNMRDMMKKGRRGTVLYKKMYFELLEKYNALITEKGQE